MLFSVYCTLQLMKAVSTTQTFKIPQVNILSCKVMKHHFKMIQYLNILTSISSFWLNLKY